MAINNWNFVEMWHTCDNSKTVMTFSRHNENTEKKSIEKKCMIWAYVRFRSVHFTLPASGLSFFTFCWYELRYEMEYRHKNIATTATVSTPTMKPAIYNWHVIKVHEFLTFSSKPAKIRTTNLYAMLNYIVQMQCHWHLFRFLLLIFVLLLSTSVKLIFLVLICGFGFCAMNPDQNAICIDIHIFQLNEGKNENRAHTNTNTHPHARIQS